MPEARYQGRSGPGDQRGKSDKQAKAVGEAIQAITNESR